MREERNVPRSRLNRLTQLGKLAGGVAGGMLSEGVRQLSRGNKPAMGDLLLTPANARRVADRLAEMRGAAMKVGQLLSMETGEFLPPELTQILSRLRKDAYSMPLGQVADVLSTAWGDGWQQQFSRFSFTPLAAASIGQVHEATLKTGEKLAIKIQYPGVRESIDSDVDNVATLLRFTNLVPAGIEFSALLDEAKSQLHKEANYEQEAEYMARFGGFLKEDSRFEVPTIVPELTGPNVLAMSFMDGAPLETAESQPQPERDRVAAALLDLSMRELFEWGWLQSDPNFANFLYNAETKKIQLLDFGATREIPADRRNQFRALLTAAQAHDHQAILDTAYTIGYAEPADPLIYREGIGQLISTACTPLTEPHNYDFSTSQLANEVADVAWELRVKEKFGRLPPPDVLFLHRRLGGLYLVFARLGARLAVREQVSPYLDLVA